MFYLVGRVEEDGNVDARERRGDLAEGFGELGYVFFVVENCLDLKLASLLLLRSETSSVLLRKESFASTDHIAFQIQPPSSNQIVPLNLRLTISKNFIVPQASAQYSGL